MPFPPLHASLTFGQFRADVEIENPTPWLLEGWERLVSRNRALREAEDTVTSCPTPPQLHCPNCGADFSHLTIVVREYTVPRICTWCRCEFERD